MQQFPPVQLVLQHSELDPQLKPFSMQQPESGRHSDSCRQPLGVQVLVYLYCSTWQPLPGPQAEPTQLVQVQGWQVPLTQYRLPQQSESLLQELPLVTQHVPPLQLLLQH